MTVEHREQRGAQERASCKQAGDQRIFLVAAQRGMIELESPAPRAFDECRARGDVPFMFGNQRECQVSASCRDQAEFVGDRAHRTHVEFRGLELFPLSAFYLGVVAGKFLRESGKTAGDFGVALVGFVLLTVWRAPPLLVVVVSALGGGALAFKD